MTETPNDAATPQETIAVLQRKLAERTAERDEALERQTVTSDILKVIARSPSDVQPVFEAIATSANKLIGGFSTAVMRLIGDDLHLAALTPTNPEADAALQAAFPGPISRFPQFLLVVRNGQTMQFPDTEAEGVPPANRDLARLRGYRSMLFTPLMSSGAPIGLISVTRSEPGPFSEIHVQLLRVFADQAVIAIQNARLFNETKEALERQTATTDVLKVIASSPSTLQPVFDAIAERSNQLIGGHSTAVYHLIDGLVHIAAFTAVSPEADATLNEDFPRPLAQVSPALASVFHGEVVHQPDVLSEKWLAGRTTADMERIRRLSAARGFRATLFVPLTSERGTIGVISVTRKEPGRFAEHHIDLLKTFASQAVIAIQNVALFDEVQAKSRGLEESLQQQTATADVLKVISRSAFDLDSVLTTLVASAAKLCEAERGLIFLLEDGYFYSAANFGFSPELEAFARANPLPADGSSTTARAGAAGSPVQAVDLLADGTQGYLAREYQRLGGHRTNLGVPLRRDGQTIGVFTLTRQTVKAFTQRQINLVQTFADQAVIAIENVRLFEEVQAKTHDLEQSLQQQTATADVLKVISRSAFDLQTVLDTLVESVTRLSDADHSWLFQRDGNVLRWAAGFGYGTEVHSQIRDYFLGRDVPLDRGSVVGRAALESGIVHLPDVLADPEYTWGHAQKIAGYRAAIGAPLLRDGRVTGVLFVTKGTPQPFTSKQIELVSTFADQAVIAIENVRLFDEVQSHTHDLAESLQQQTATADVLKVISRSTFDLQTVLQTLVESAAKLCDAEQATITRQKDGVLFRGEFYGFSDEFMNYVRNVPVVPDRGSATARALLEGAVVHIADVRADPDYTFDEAQRLGDFRTIMGVPMLREGKAIGVIVMTRSEVRPFTDKQIELATTFADQAAIAIENVRLFENVEARTRELATSLEDLRAAQDRLIQTEKLASLGQLTAGIAHEIKNPLNFVNNFSSLSAELIDELTETLASTGLDNAKRGEIEELTATLKGNLEKIRQHGQRADSIVKNMLLHSREGAGEQRSVDINALVDEGLNLAYHGARAEKPGFNITLQRKLDPAAGQADIFPQEVTRVLLNIISNGFYAATRRAGDAGNGFAPTISAETSNLGGRVEIRIRDNGIGMRADVKAKIFTPFFTTKPPGEGTGLGLSMSHDIIVKQHGGSIDVETEPGSFTEFIITLPRQAADKKKTGGQG